MDFSKDWSGKWSFNCLVVNFPFSSTLSPDRNGECVHLDDQWTLLVTRKEERRQGKGSSQIVAPREWSDVAAIKPHPSIERGDWRHPRPVNTGREYFRHRMLNTTLQWATTSGHSLGWAKCPVCSLQGRTSLFIHSQNGVGEVPYISSDWQVGANQLLQVPLITASVEPTLFAFLSLFLSHSNSQQCSTKLSSTKLSFWFLEQTPCLFLSSDTIGDR